MASYVAHQPLSKPQFYGFNFVNVPPGHRAPCITTVLEHRTHSCIKRYQ